MRPYDPARLLVSVHVPKCAGTSFAELLQSWFGARLHLHYPDADGEGPPARAPHEAGGCVHGHFFHHAYRIGVDDYYPGAQTITVLRDPLDMIVSGYFYARRECIARHARHARLVDHLDEVLGWPDLFPYRNLPFDVRGPDLEGALRRRFVWVGVADRLDEGAAVLAHRLGRPAPARLPVRNAAVRDEAVPEGYRERLRAAFPAEHRVYDTVRAIAVEEIGT